MIPQSEEPSEYKKSYSGKEERMIKMFEKKIAPVSLDHVQIQDKFWKEYMELVRNHVIPYQWEALNDRIENAEPSYCIQNFRVAAGL